MAAGNTFQRGQGSGSRVGLAALQIVLGALTPLLLLSIGGAGIYAAPALLPLLWVTAHASRGGLRVYLTVLAALTAAETIWAFAWSLIPSLQAILPLSAVVATGFLFAKTCGRALPSRVVALLLVALAGLGATGPIGLADGESTTTREMEAEPID